jgi:hypothetical protein
MICAISNWWEMSQNMSCHHPWIMVMECLCCSLSVIQLCRYWYPTLTSRVSMIATSIDGCLHNDPLSLCMLLFVSPITFQFVRIPISIIIYILSGSTSKNPTNPSKSWSPHKWYPKNEDNEQIASWMDYSHTNTFIICYRCWVFWDMDLPWLIT